MGLVGFSGFLGRYLSGLCVATLGLCAAGWLALAPFAFGYQGAGLRQAALTDRATGVGVALVSLVTLVSWVVAWRRTLRADGILAGPSRWQARRDARARRGERDGEGTAGPADPAQVLSELRALLIPLLAASANGQALAGIPEPRDEPGEFGGPDGGRPEPGSCEPGYHAVSCEPGYQAVSREPGYHTVSREPDHHQAAPGVPAGHGTPAVPSARSGGLAAIESMLAGPELLMVGGGEEEAW